MPWLGLADAGLLLVKLCEQRFSLGGKCVGSIHIARIKRIVGLFQPFPDLRGSFLFLVVEGPGYACKAALSGRDGIQGLLALIRSPT